MQHISTRGEAPPLSFPDALLAGLARDGGLYVPEAYPTLDREAIAELAGQSYAAIAKTVLGALIGGDIEARALGRMIDEAYAGFRHPAVCPLVQLDANLFALELFHGPTLAFKDVAMQLLGRLMDHVLSGRRQRATIVGATSGDTGSAAIEAFKGLANVDIFILFPHGRVSDVQRRQMTTVDAPNVHAIAVDGDFDDCQALVKAMFNDHAFRDKFQLSGVNSINWARIAAQVVYYFSSATALGAPHRPVSFSVPTGNFGDILAGWVAKRMGLPIERLMIATNVNDILPRALADGRYEAAGVTATTSPSMDIQVSSNFERALFEAHGRDAAAIRGLMGSFAQSRGFAINDDAMANLKADYDAASVSEEAVASTIAQTLEKVGYLLDPHTAIGVAAARKLSGPAPTVVLGTAHPAKFPDAVETACGVRPELPPHLADLMTRPEEVSRLPNELAAVQAFVTERTRAGRKRAWWSLG